MITLTIFKKDGSVYWVEHFNSKAEADKWIAEEKTRPYYGKDWTVEIVEPAPASEVKPDFAAMRQAKKAELKSLNTVAEIRAWIEANLL